MSYQYKTPDDVNPKVGSWSKRIEWCEKNCKGKWEYKLKGEFVFHNEKDYVFFMLRWS